MKIRYSAENLFKIQNSVPALVQTDLNFKILYPVPVQPNLNPKIWYPVPVGKTLIRLYPTYECSEICHNIGIPDILCFEVTEQEIKEAIYTRMN